MMDGYNTTFGCSCKPCILMQVSQLEKNKLYREADRVLTDGIRHYSMMMKDLEEERIKFRSKLKHDPYFQKLLEESRIEPVTLSSPGSLAYVGSSYTSHFAQKTVKNARCQSFLGGGGVTNDSKSQSVLCPVAIFEPVDDAKQKPMYPKHLVYADGKDTQLEEIRAAAYWAKIRNQRAPESKLVTENAESVENIGATVKTKNMVMSNLKGGSPVDITNLPSRNVKTTAEAKLSSENADFPLNLLDTENIDTHRECSSLKLKHTVPERTSRSSTTARSWSKFDECVRDNEQPNSKLLADSNVIISTSVASLQHSGSVDCKPTAITSTAVTTAAAEPILTVAEENGVTAPSSREVERASEPVVVTAMASEKENFSRDNLSHALPVRDTNWRAPTPSLSSPSQNDVSVAALDSVQPQLTIEGENDKVPSIITADVQNDGERAVAGVTFTIYDDEKELDDTCNTKAFALMLPSSTPNRRKSQMFRHSANVNGTYTIDSKAASDCTTTNTAAMTGQNLSMILELSKERSSSSSGGSSVIGNATAFSKISGVPEKTCLSAINETDENVSGKPAECSGSKIVLVPDPFDLELIESLLEKTKFSPKNDWKNVCRVNTDMPLVKQSSTVKLGNEKFSVVGEIGRGSYARILKAHVLQKPTKLVALKQQKPACLWEYYISEQIRRRLNPSKNQYFMEYSNIFIYKNGSMLISEWAQYGSVLNFINTLKTSNYPHNRCPTAVVIHLSVQLVTAIEYLHSCQIIHGDVKPDNFVLYRAVTGDKPCVKLIDYGRSIDMTLFPENAVFSKVVTTEDFTCNEMKENRYWTFQTDLYGLAGTMYLLLVGEYMKTAKGQDGSWMLKKPLPRYINKDLWNPIFDTLLNVPSCFQLPNLADLKHGLQDFYSSLDKHTVTQHFGTIPSIFKK